MEVALRRRLEGVAEVSISQSQQTATVTFLPRTRVFSATAFKEAVAEAAVETLSLNVDACGVVDSENGLRLAGHEKPFLMLRGNIPLGQLVCVTGRLDEAVQPYALEINVTDTVTTTQQH